MIHQGSTCRTYACAAQDDPEVDVDEADVAELVGEPSAVAAPTAQARIEIATKERISDVFRI